MYTYVGTWILLLLGMFSAIVWNIFSFGFHVTKVVHLYIRGPGRKKGWPTHTPWQQGHLEALAPTSCAGPWQKKEGGRGEECISRTYFADFFFISIRLFHPTGILNIIFIGIMSKSLKLLEPLKMGFLYIITHKELSIIISGSNRKLFTIWCGVLNDEMSWKKTRGTTVVCACVCVCVCVHVWF